VDAGTKGFLLCWPFAGVTCPAVGIYMSAQIIRLSDHRRTRPTPSSSLIDLQLSFFAAYVDVSLAAYLSVVKPLSLAGAVSPPKGLS
jgi:hypothetical protein